VSSRCEGYKPSVAEDRAIERDVAARERPTGSPRRGRLSAHAVLITSLLVVSLTFAAPANAGRWNEIDGTASADSIRGTSASDRIRGVEGDDVLHGSGGDDRLVGGPGDDVLVGGPGRDTYVCGAGEDLVVVEFLRHIEHFGDGCEAAVFDV
jgi:hypothetical protein